MKLAVATYPMDFLRDWAAYAEKLDDWISEAARAGASLCVFPEYGALEVATLDGAEVSGDLRRSVDAVSGRIAEVNGLHADLARKHRLHILAASAPVIDPEISEHPVNRARLFAPSGDMGVQDKQIMTRFERDIWGIVPGGPLRIFETELGRIGILICYDVEFPLLARAVSEADLLLVPSVTEAMTGHNRVRIGARARALENQCIAAMASLTGTAAWTEAADLSTGRGGVFGPPDLGFPDDGILAQGDIDRPGWTFAECDLDAVHRVRQDGVVLNRAHWPEQSGRDAPAPVLALR